MEIERKFEEERKEAVGKHQIKRVEGINLNKREVKTEVEKKK